MIELGSNETTSQTGTKITVPLKNEEDRKQFEKEVVLQINKEEFVPCKLKLEKFDDESLIIYLLNLSTEKKIEERLFETTEQINAIIKTAVDGIITIDQKGLIETVNPAKIPFIFLTAKVDKEDIRRGMNMGADDYLTKPFSDVELMDAVEVRLKKAEILMDEYGSDHCPVSIEL